ncbi:MAG: hypothetical protein O7C59_09415 [Rickettsia endosymbiont of Ixodes persulcatus]|nr:hypothetical protein [Rickettsia endosymbiont of Ixodes persulcatus]MCZ6901886.1 hypothetical protein [Rickettsia endosymbiont of Ixodes persulcatus]MCZ6903599.1 hypothetical protein [Rickettsia endosymbiont of Ixodes persulcatus]MCZ6909470.1 hypothetical protein [Rickettsia endosymbiont of Ixodes persulcatus]MCZ6911090.1 hypothetical protein [Rickettsia endosymbiont of Ixodes persulcatus]
MYAAGDLCIYKIVDQKNPVYLSLQGRCDLTDKEIIYSLDKIIQGQRAFFSDNDFSYYLISLIEGDNPRHMGGTGLTNSFTAFILKGLDKYRYTTLLAHEHLHNWIGQKIDIGEDEELKYWWREGFTDYYSRVLALRSGVITFEEFINECNQFFEDYYLSPVLNEPNSKIKSEKDNGIKKLPYYRGFVFALYLDNLIKDSNKNKSLDNVMLNLF